MTDRLAELHLGSTGSGPSASAYDEEAGDVESDRLLEGFNREASAIDKVLKWASATIADVSSSFSSSSPDAASARTAQLDKVEEKVNAVRRRLKNMGDANRDFAREHSNRPATVRTRIVRYTKLGKDFLKVTGDLEDVRSVHRDALSSSVKQRILDTNPGVSEAQVDRALASGEGVESVLVDANTADMRHQLNDIRSRTADIAKLNRSMVELHQMFTDMSILVEAQQELLNNVEYNVQEGKSDVKQAAEELTQARAHQKSKRKKKICIIAIVVAILIAIALAIAIPIIQRSQNSRARMIQAPFSDPQSGTSTPLGLLQGGLKKAETLSDHP